MTFTPVLTAADFRVLAGTGVTGSVQTNWADTSKYPDALIDARVATFTSIFTRYRGYAPTPTQTVYVTPAQERHRWGWDDCGWTGRIQLPYPLLISVDSATFNGDDAGDPPVGLTIADLGASVIQVTKPGIWAVTFTHGAPEADPISVDAAVEYVKARLYRNNSQTPREAIQMGDANAGISYRFSTPDASAGRPTGYLDVDALLNMTPDLRGVGVG